MNDTMFELLEAWKELEPEWCSELYEGAFYVQDRAGDSRGWHLVLSEHQGDKDGFYPWQDDALMHIQYAVQQAIVARGWTFFLLKYFDHDYYQVEIRTPGERGFEWSELGDSAAEALLRAYVAVLKKEQGNEDIHSDRRRQDGGVGIPRIQPELPRKGLSGIWCQSRATGLSQWRRGAA